MPRPPLEIPHEDIAAEGDGDLPEHVEQSVQTLAEVHIEHYRSASRRQRFIDRITDALARPVSVIVIGLALAAWAAVIAANPDSAGGREAYTSLELTATIAALLVAVLILVTQTREDRLTQRREQLTLELALVADKRLAKLIELVQAIHDAAPTASERPDSAAQQMAEPIDADAVLKEIDRRADPKA